MTILKTRTKQEDIPLQASKWLQLPALLDEKEIRDLLKALEPFTLFYASGVLEEGKEEVSLEEWLSVYTQVIEGLKLGKPPVEELLRKYHTLFLTRSFDALYRLEVGEKKSLMRVLWPVIQIQWHRLSYSVEDQQFRSQVHGKNTFFWGVQFSYPQIMINPLNKQPEKVDDRPILPNTSLFKTLQKWLRANTAPTPFRIGDQKINFPARIGLACFSWIQHHPQLIEQGIKIESRSQG